jgi:hypothetical protein
VCRAQRQQQLLNRALPVWGMAAVKGAELTRDRRYGTVCLCVCMQLCVRCECPRALALATSAPDAGPRMLGCVLLVGLGPRHTCAGD